jgi:hypothetical protein
MSDLETEIKNFSLLDTESNIFQRPIITTIGLCKDFLLANESAAHINKARLRKKRDSIEAAVCVVKILLLVNWL